MEINGHLHRDPWFEDYAESAEEEESGVADFNLSVTPNDFSVSTIFELIERGTIVIPGFQRHFVWDLKKSSKLIESLILGLPVPQLFLYEQNRTKFIVIDGQQRLMSIYYFKKQRFPHMNVRAQLRRIFAENGSIPDDVLEDDVYFADFQLRLPGQMPHLANLLHGRSYDSLGETYQFQFDIRPIRNVVIKQTSPNADDYAVHEIFNRLNSGGVNLRPQEIRASLYHSPFYNMLMEVNLHKGWRRILNRPEPDLYQKDVEVLLRIFALLIDGENYSPSMMKFLDKFSLKSQDQKEEKNAYLRSLLISFLDAAEALPPRAFANVGNNRFNIALIEAVFTAACSKAFQEGRRAKGRLSVAEVEALKSDGEFMDASTLATTQTSNVRTRLERGKHYIKAL